jgi:DNA helicase IV
MKKGFPRESRAIRHNGRPRERGAVTSSTTDEIDLEQSYVDQLYARLDQLRERTAAELATVRRTAPTGTHQNRSERDAFATLHEYRLAQLMAVEDRLAFGRLDLTSGTRRYVGRLGLSDDEHTQLLVDWRAPAARSFYQATAASPGDVVRRRHLATRERTVVGVEDEVLDLEHMDGSARATLSGEGALLAAIGSERTGRMADIVATIQGEQDRVIRSDLAGVLVVQGGPGTGKTAVALHRAAYLLYTHRERLARSGVLVVGPNSLFLRYIEQVLPSLGETGVVMSTPGELYPGIEGIEGEAPEVAALKGDPRMARVVARAVHERERVPSDVRRLTVDSYVIGLRPEVVASARGRARRTRKPHNAAREGYLKDLLGHLAGELAESMRTELTQDNRSDLLDELRDSADVRRELNLTWMPLTPEQLLQDLFASPELLADCSPDLSPAERALLLRERSSPWTVADVPLLDEAAELLGEDDTAARLAARRQAAERSAEVGYAQATLSAIGSGGIQVSAETLAGRFADTGPTLTVAERAESDRTWAFGHVVVDEAQELSPMMWRLLMRRCPTRSMTLVGDVAQVGSAAGTSSWGAALDPYVHDRWRLEALTVNYRTPAAIMRIASEVLTGAGVSAPMPKSVREGDSAPTADIIPVGLDTGDAAALDAVRVIVAKEVAALGRGRLVVVAPADVAGPLRAHLRDTLPNGTVGQGRTALDSPVVVLTVHEVKGLEFDAVVLVEPATILKASPRGANDLYVALTRPTQRLRVLASGDLPTGLDALPLS